MTHLSDLLQPVYYKPAAKCLGVGLALFLAAFWQPADRRSPGFGILLLGFGWAVCHVLVNNNSYVFPPKEPADWLVFGALTLVPVAAIVWIQKRGEGGAAVLAGILLGVTAWLALQKVPWFLDRAETPRDKWLWTSGIISAVLASFGAAEALARKVPAVLVLAVLAIFIVLAGTTLLPERDTARILAVAAFTLGAAVAGLVHSFRRQPVATLPAGIAGWIAGAGVLLFILACLSRVAGVPVVPMGIAAATLPVTALVIYTLGRAVGGAPLIFAILVLGGGAAVAWFAASERQRPASAAPTGADDTGAYDDL